MNNFGFETTVDGVAQAFAGEIKGKTILITGCSPGGLGAETARAIAKHNPSLIILAGRSFAKLQEVEQQLKSTFPNVSFRLLDLDLGSLAKVRKAAEEVNSYKEPIDRLINNAGISGVPFSLTEDGIEVVFATNHIGHFLFTNLIMPRILAAGPGARVVTVASKGYRFGPVRYDDINFDNGKKYNWVEAYGQSKKANILFGAALARRLEKHGVFSFSTHPGSIMTNLTRQMSTEDMMKLGWVDENRIPIDKVMKWKTLPQGAATQVLAAFGPAIEGDNGSYFEDCKIATETLRTTGPSPADLGEAEKLWKLSEELVGQKFDYGSGWKSVSNI